MLLVALVWQMLKSERLQWSGLDFSSDASCIHWRHNHLKVVFHFKLAWSFIKFSLPILVRSKVLTIDHRIGALRLKFLPWWISHWSHVKILIKLAMLLVSLIAIAFKHASLARARLPWWVAMRDLIVFVRVKSVLSMIMTVSPIEAAFKLCLGSLLAQSRITSCNKFLVLVAQFAKTLSAQVAPTSAAPPYERRGQDHACALTTGKRAHMSATATIWEYLLHFFINSAVSIGLTRRPLTVKCSFVRLGLLRHTITIGF